MHELPWESWERSLQGFAFWVWAFVEEAVYLFKPNICYTASDQGGTNSTREEDKRIKTWNKTEAAEDNGVRFSWIRQKQMDESFNCMLQILKNGS